MPGAHKPCCCRRQQLLSSAFLWKEARRKKNTVIAALTRPGHKVGEGSIMSTVGVPRSPPGPRPPSVGLSSFSWRLNGRILSQ